MGTPLGPKYIPYTYMDPLGKAGGKPGNSLPSRVQSPGREKHPGQGGNYRSTL